MGQIKNIKLHIVTDIKVNLPVNVNMVTATDEETMEIAPVEEVTTSEDKETDSLKEGLKVKEALIEETTEEPVSTSEETTVGKEQSATPVIASDELKAEVKTNGEEIDETKVESKCESSKPEETNEDILAQFENEFKERYTENDAGYKAVLELKEASPPVVTNFGSSRDSSSSSSRPSRSDERSSSSKRTRSRSRSRSRSKSPSRTPAKRQGAFGCYSYFVFYY